MASLDSMIVTVNLDAATAALVAIRDVAAQRGELETAACCRDALWKIEETAQKVLDQCRAEQARDRPMASDLTPELQAWVESGFDKRRVVFTAPAGALVEFYPDGVRCGPKWAALPVGYTVRKLYVNRRTGTGVVIQHPSFAWVEEGHESPEPEWGWWHDSAHALKPSVPGGVLMGEAKPFRVHDARPVFREPVYHDGKMIGVSESWDVKGEPHTCKRIRDFAEVIRAKHPELAAEVAKEVQELMAQGCAFAAAPCAPEVWSADPASPHYATLREKAADLYETATVVTEDGLIGGTIRIDQPTMTALEIVRLACVPVGGTPWHLKCSRPGYPTWNVYDPWQAIAVVGGMKFVVVATPENCPHCGVAPGARHEVNCSVRRDIPPDMEPVYPAPRTLDDVKAMLAEFADDSGMDADKLLAMLKPEAEAASPAGSPPADAPPWRPGREWL